jgi:hypothetical protein
MTSRSKLTTTASSTTNRKGKRSRPSNNSNPETAAAMAVSDPSSAAAAVAAPSSNSNSNTVYSSSVESYLANANGTSFKRIRTPHPHDVLSGRGGGINSHPGNVTFRAWVATRKNDYNLALNKADKAAVAKQVVEMVKAQNPPGRFLTKDPTASSGMGGLGGWWVELDEERTMAKTAQALREGAPAIRAEHADELIEMKKEIVEHRRHKHKEHKHHQQQREHEEISRGGNGNEETDDVAIPSRGESEDVYAEEPASLVLPSPSYMAPPPQKRVRVHYNGNVVRPTDETPPLLPSEPVLALADLPPLEDHRIFPLPVPLPKRPSETGDSLKRAHSLAFSEDTSLGEWVQDDFVNPFEGEDEMARLEAIRNAASSGGSNSSNHPLPSRTGFTSTSGRDTSTASSHGDMGGISALLHGNHHGSGSNNSINHNSSSGGTGHGNHRSGSSSVRSRTSLGNVSSRYELDGFSFDGNRGEDDLLGRSDFTMDDFRDLIRGWDPLAPLSNSDADHPEPPSSSSEPFLQWWELPVIPRPVSPYEAL